MTAVEAEAVKEYLRTVGRILMAYGYTQEAARALMYQHAEEVTDGWNLRRLPAHVAARIMMADP